FSDLWNRITNEFKDLNQNYQDFLKKFQESKTEELLESEIFLEYKNKMVAYLQDFIQGYLTNGNKIKKTIMNLDENIEDKIVKKLEDYQRENPRIYPEFNYEKFNEINRGRYRSIKNWFVGESNKSEGDRLLDVTNSIIMQITKCASSLIELHGNMIARKEEYKHLCKLFDSKDNIKDSHELSSVVFGVTNVTHYKGLSNLNTDSLILSYDVAPTEIEVEPHEKRNRREKSYITIVSKAEEKKKLIERLKKEEEHERQILLNLIKSGEINLSNQVELTKEERNYVLKLIARNTKKEVKENVLGLTYTIENLEGTCKIVSPDGVFTMDSIKIVFKGGIPNE
ncbi:MAG: DUF2397 domain-containing protein, partial [Bacilli bacterium]|nr:DUF2397 domain-containing protein [Bacilli bacterium]